MKRKCYIIFLLILICTSGCDKIVTSKSLEINDYKEVYNGDTANGIIMTIKKETLTPVSATIIIEDRTGENHYYVSYARLYRNENNRWVSMNWINDSISTTTELYFTNGNEKIEINQNWEETFGKLSKGKYKIVKYVEDDLNAEQKLSISTDFEIN